MARVALSLVVWVSLAVSAHAQSTPVVDSELPPRVASTANGLLLNGEPISPQDLRSKLFKLGKQKGKIWYYFDLKMPPTKTYELSSGVFDAADQLDATLVISGTPDFADLKKALSEEKK